MPGIFFHNKNKGEKKELILPNKEKHKVLLSDNPMITGKRLMVIALGALLLFFIGWGSTTTYLIDKNGRIEKASNANLKALGTSPGKASNKATLDTNGEVQGVYNQLELPSKIDKIPTLAPNAVYRQKPLEQLQTLFFEKEKNREPLIVAIVGNPADGKTELAKQYANRFKDRYYHRWFVQVENWESEYRNLAKIWKLFPEIDSLQIDVVVHAVHTVFSEKRAQGQEKSLIIFDNAPAGFIFEKLKMQLPSNTDVLATSKDTDWDNKLTLSEKPYHLTTVEGVEILRTWIGEKRFDPNEARKIVDRFSHLPVVIANAGCYIEKAQTMAIKDFLPIFEANKSKVLKCGKHSSQHRDVATSLQLIVQRLDPQALELLLHCAYLPAKNIPPNLLIRLLKIDQVDLNHHLTALGTLVICDEGKITIHDLLQDILVEEFLPAQKEKYLSRLAAISENFEEFLLSNRDKAIPIYEQGLKEAEEKEDHQKVVHFSVRLGGVYMHQGQYAKALIYNQQALRTCQETLGENNLTTAINYVSVGNNLEKLGQYNVALDCQYKALNIRKELLSDNQIAVAECLNNIALCYHLQGKYQKALEFHMQALKIKEAQLGQDHPDLAKSLHEMALCYHSQGNYLKTLEFNSHALKIRELSLGTEHPDVAATLNSIARCYYAIGKYDDALNIYFKALKIREVALGKDHLEVVETLFGIANCRIAQGTYDLALKIHLDVLKIRKASLGNEHPRVAGSLYYIALCHYHLGEYEKALKFYTQALNIRKAKLGEDHSHVGFCLSGIANCYCIQGKYKEALTLLFEALKILKAALGNDHPRIAETFHSMGNCYYAQSQYEKALESHEQALKIREAALGHEHPKVAESLVEIQKCHHKIEKKD